MTACGPLVCLTLCSGWLWRACATIRPVPRKAKQGRICSAMLRHALPYMCQIRSSTASHAGPQPSVRRDVEGGVGRAVEKRFARTGFNCPM